MARIRYLKPEFFFDEDLAELPFENRLCYAGLWVNADKSGRLEDSPKKLKAVIFPYDKININDLLDNLTKKPFVWRYSVDGKNYIQIINWEKHQKPHHTEKESTFPPYNPLKDKGNGKGNGKDKDKPAQSELEVKQPLNNGELTVKRISSTIPPIYEEVEKYCKERDRGVDPEAWMNHYQAKGWMIGKNKMKDWKAAVRTWEKDGKQNLTQAQKNSIAGMQRLEKRWEDEKGNIQKGTGDPAPSVSEQGNKP